MNIIFKGDLTGAEIMARNPKKKLDQNALFEYSEGDRTGSNGIIDCICNRKPTQEELMKNTKEQEIQELNTWLDDRKNIPDSAMTPEQVVERNDKYARLLELLG